MRIMLYIGSIKSMLHKSDLVMICYDLLLFLMLIDSFGDLRAPVTCDFLRFQRPSTQPSGKMLTQHGILLKLPFLSWSALVRAVRSHVSPSSCAIAMSILGDCLGRTTCQANGPGRRRAGWACWKAATWLPFSAGQAETSSDAKLALGHRRGRGCCRMLSFFHLDVQPQLTPGQ